MLIIGCDYHPSFQQNAWVDTGSGECGEQQLQHSNGEAEKFYRDLKLRGMQVRVGMEATGHARWFERLLAELQYELWVGDPAQIKAARVRKQKTDRRDARALAEAAGISARTVQGAERDAELGAETYVLWGGREGTEVDAAHAEVGGQIGVRLFHRSTRRLALTEAGERFLEDLAARAAHELRLLVRDTLVVEAPQRAATRDDRGDGSDRLVEQVPHHPDLDDQRLALAATERRVETAPDRIRHPGRSVRRYGKHAPIGLLGDDLGLGRGGERQQGQEPDPRRLDITQVSVHSHKSVDLGRPATSYR